MYDVSCTLKKHLEVSMQVEHGDRDELILHICFRKVNGPTEVLECVKFSVPSFHAYGHKPACQVSYKKSLLNHLL